MFPRIFFFIPDDQRFFSPKDTSSATDRSLAGSTIERPSLATQLNRSSVATPKTGATSNIKLLVANVDGLYTFRNKTKVKFLEELCTSQNISFICVCESHLNPTIRDAEVKMNGFVLHRTDRSGGRRKGGVAVYVKECASWNAEVVISYSNSVVEMLGIYIREQNLLIIIIYRPPECEYRYFKDSLNKMNIFLSSLPAPLPEIIIAGDLNLPHVDWATVTTTDAPTVERLQAALLKDTMEDWCLSQYVRCPTRGRNILDVVISNNVNLIANITTEVTTHSDHRFLVVETNISTCQKAAVKRKDEQSPFDELNFHSDRVDWFALQEELSSVPWVEEMRGKSVDEKHDFFISRTLQVCQRHVPQKRAAGRVRRIPRDRRALMRRRARLRSKINFSSNHHNVALMEVKVARLEAALKQSMDRERADEELKASQSIKRNPKFFYQFAKNKSTVRTRIGPLKNQEGTLETDPRRMAVLLKEQYERVFSSPDQLYEIQHPDNFFSEPEANEPILSELELCRDDFVRTAARLRSSAAAGPDGFPAILVKQCSWQLSVPLVIMWQSSLQEGRIPQALKTARVTPIYKGGSRSSPASYRPVALTSHIVKLFERVLAEKIVTFMEENSLLNDRQHGFRKGRSCLSQLLDNHDRVLDALAEGAGVDVIYLDFWKAFDQVDIGLLLHKARRLGVTGQIGRWLHAFLTGRTQSVVVEGSSSGKSRVISGVPQGSVLGPILFLLLIGDVDVELTHSMASSFADDTKVVGRIAGIRDVYKRQTDLEKLYNWTDDSNVF